MFREANRHKSFSNRAKRVSIRKRINQPLETDVVFQIIVAILEHVYVLCLREVLNRLGPLLSVSIVFSDFIPRSLQQR
eukprot:02529_6